MSGVTMSYRVPSFGPDNHHRYSSPTKSAITVDNDHCTFGANWHQYHDTREQLMNATLILLQVACGKRVRKSTTREPELLAFRPGLYNTTCGNVVTVRRLRRHDYC